jgi:hypothetical protein
MPLTLFGVNGYPHDVLVTKANVPLEQCAFLLDFTRPLEKLRWLGAYNRRVGVPVALLVPVVHLSEETGQFIVGVHRSDPYFKDIPKLWNKHRGHPRTRTIVAAEGLQLAADFAVHFPEDLPK